MSVLVTLDLQINPEKQDEFLKMVKEKVIQGTRAYDGCELFDIYTDQDKPGHVLFHEVWETRAKQEKYFAWRQETGVVDKLAAYFSDPPVITYYDQFDA